MSPDSETTSITFAGRLVRWFVMGLPLGLILMGVLSFYFYFQKREAKPPAASDLAVMLRKEINAPDFERYLRVLNQEIGVRNLRHMENLEVAIAYIESTLGYDNMGYQVTREEFSASGQKLVNLSVELPGKTKPQEVVLVLSSYDTPDANDPEWGAGLAGLFSLAHAFTGTAHDRTIRFATVVEAQAVNPQENGASVLAQSQVDKKESVHSLFLLPRLPDPWTMPAEWNAAKVLNVAVPKDSAALITSLPELKAKIEAAAKDS